MLPANFVGLLLLLAALAPGYVYVRVAEQRRSRPDRSALLETAEFLVIGAASTTVAVLVLVALAERTDDLVIDLPRWAREGSTYLEVRPYAVARSVGAVLGGACGLAYLGARFIHRGQPPNLVPGVTVRAAVFEPAGRPGRRAWVAVHRKDGSVIEGYLLAYPTGGSDAQEIALQKPIGLTPSGDRRSLVAGVDCVLVAAEEITMVGVRIEDDG